MTLALPPTIGSRQDVVRLRTEVERYAAWVGQYQNASKREVTYQAEQPHLSEPARALLRDWLTNKQSLADLIKTLNTYASKAPSITVTLAHPPSPKVQADLVVWARRELDPNMLVELRWNARLMGGMVVRTDNAVYDWSHRRMLFEARPKLIERLMHV
jgi:hypothetical protein